MNATDVLNVVDLHNLSLLKMPSESVSLMNYNPLFDKNVSENDFVWCCIKKDVTDAMWNKLYANNAEVERRGNDVYRRFIRKVSRREGKSWVCFKNTTISVSTGMAIGKTLYYGDTPEEAVQAFLSANA